MAVLAFLLTPLVLPALTAPQKPNSHARARAQHMGIPRLRAVPTIPNASRAAGNRVILEKADKLYKEMTDSFMRVSGSVKFSKGPMLMYCDSAFYSPETNSFDAFGNVRMEQGDTLFIYADELNYDGPQEIAYLYGYQPTRPVRMINRDVKLETDVFTYDMLLDIGYYNTGGVLTDKKNRLTSDQGEYIPGTKDANFFQNVHLTSLSEKDTLNIFTDTLYYNTTTHVAEFFSPTEIVNPQGNIVSTEGTYNTVTDVANLFQHSLVKTNRGTTLEGDTLFYDRKTGLGEAFGNMAIVDSARQSTLRGDYGFYNELIDSAFVTGRALAMEYSRGDTLYMHGRYITSVLRIDSVEQKQDTLTVMVPDTTHVVNSWPRVRFFRSDMQGVCDSMALVERDSTLFMHYHPIVWSEERQVFGNLIQVHLNDSTVDRADLPDFAFVAQHIEDDFYNQLTGKSMTAYFDGGEMRQLDVSGSVEAIFYPEESDSTINKMVTVQSSFLTAWMSRNNIDRMKRWPESSGVATPLYLAKRSMLLLPKFQWFGPIRPKDPDDIFGIPPEMDELMSDSPVVDFLKKAEPEPDAEADTAEASDCTAEAKPEAAEATAPETLKTQETE